MNTSHEREMELTLNGVKTLLSYSDIGVGDHCIVYLHGLGSDRNDFLPACSYPGFAGFRLLVMDLPGHGLSSYPTGISLTVDDLAQALHEFVTTLRLKKIHLVGHSLGGAIALRYAAQFATNLVSFTNIEGNLVSEDCGILSREIRNRPFFGQEGDFFSAMTNILHHIPLTGYKDFANNYLSRLNSTQAWHDYCQSLIELSDSGELLKAFLELTVRRTYIHGDQNQPALLSTLEQNGIEIIAIPGSSHWPMCSNPEEFYNQLATSLDSSKGLTQ